VLEVVVLLLGLKDAQLLLLGLKVAPAAAVA